MGATAGKTVLLDSTGEQSPASFIDNIAKDDWIRFNVQTKIYSLLGEAMKLLHPFMPFISEEIYCTLHPEEETVMTAAWPRYTEERSFPKDEEMIGLYKELVRGTRAIRSEMNEQARTVNQRMDQAEENVDQRASAAERASDARATAAETISASPGILLWIHPGNDLNCWIFPCSSTTVPSAVFLAVTCS